ncbi:hypothetical protein ABEF93_008113 [Exophiala dermatitidis]
MQLSEKMRVLSPSSVVWLPPHLRSLFSSSRILYKNALSCSACRMRFHLYVSGTRTMASSKHIICSLVLLVTAPTVLTYPIAHAHAHVGTPELGALSFAELTQHTFRRILELGFLRGVVVSLLVLGSLVCLLICVLSILATYLGRHDTHHQSQQVEQDNGVAVQEKAAPHHYGETKRAIGAIHNEHIQRQQLQLGQSLPPRRGIIRYILGQDHHPIIRINTIHTSNSSPRNPTPKSITTTTTTTTTTSSPRSTSTPKLKLRSALSKSPPPQQPRLFSTRAQSFLFGQRRSSPQSPKSVRWADELQISLITTTPTSTTVEMEFETDIGLSSPSPVTEGCDCDSDYFRP